MNNKGFTLYSFISLAPLLLTLAFMLCWTFWFLNEKHKMDNLCNHYNLKAQEILLQHNNYLMALNYKAWALIIEKRSLDAIILVAPPPVKIPAKVRRRIVVAEQYALKKIQQGLIFKANLQARSQAFLLRKKFMEMNRKLENYWQSSAKNPKIKIHWENSKIEPRFKEIAPPYKRSKNHSSLQELKVYWEIPLESIMPTWLKNFIPVHKKWKGQCFSHPQERRTGWVAQIGKAKLL